MHITYQRANQPHPEKYGPHPTWERRKAEPCRVVHRASSSPPHTVMVTTLSLNYVFSSILRYYLECAPLTLEL